MNLLPTPQAAVDEDGGFVFGEDDVGEVFDVEAEAVAHAVEDGADEEFRFGVFGFDPGHVPRPPFFCKAVFCWAVFQWGD
jgi:hypothetical protein